MYLKLSILISFVLISMTNGIPSSKECTEKIDRQISEINPKGKGRMVAVPTASPCLFCMYEKVVEFKRDPNSRVDVKKQNGGYSYSVTIVHPNVTDYCGCKIKPIQNITIPNNVTKQCDAESGTWANVDRKSKRTARQATSDDRYLRGESLNSKIRIHLFVRDSGVAEVKDVEAVELPKRRVCSCDGSLTVTDECKCSTTNGGPVKNQKDKVIPCYVSNNDGYHVIVEALTCT